MKYSNFESFNRIVYTKTSIIQTEPIAQVVERPLWDREVAGSILGRAIPKA